VADPSDFPDDQVVLARVSRAIEAAVPKGTDIKTLAGQLIRQAIDEVIDAPRTKRLLLAHCEKTEKTYLGTKIEILLRSRLKLKKGQVLDLLVDGIEVDIKHSIARSWMIPREAIGRVCLLVTEHEQRGEFSLGLLMCRPENLRIAANQDRKVGVSADGLARAHWIVRNERYPKNIWIGFDPDLLDSIRKLRGGTKRLVLLFRKYQRKPVSRSAVAAIATQLDPMKRIRGNGGARSVLKPDRVAILSGKYHSELALELGLPRLYPDEFVSVTPRDDDELDRLRAANLL
tara:strand:+ start:487 stop:1350 length:864 start_codon:yes stop_codon:yes gene_type:complete